MRQVILRCGQQQVHIYVCISSRPLGVYRRGSREDRVDFPLYALHP